MSAGTSLTLADGNPQSFTPEPYPPVQADLDSLAAILHRTNRTRILEYGVGWSTDVFARHILAMNEDLMWGSIVAPPWEFHVDVVDAGMHFIGAAAKRILEDLGEDADDCVSFHHKQPELVSIGNWIASCYPFMPKVPPDFIYIDAPEGYQTKLPDTFVPIIGDVIRYEPYLLPNTIIVIDGRAAQARFLFRNLKNTWAYRYCDERDQHIFVQVEGTRGFPKHDRILKEIYYAKGEWTIDDL